jgi:hypothetical protein
LGKERFGRKAKSEERKLSMGGARFKGTEERRREQKE